jgi:glutamine amidotransferase-like uncharacterized protein
LKTRKTSLPHKQDRTPRQLRWPEVGIYVGTGASHSWTWFADIFEHIGLYTVTFLDQEDVREGALDNIDVFLVSGGDTFAMADGLGPLGAKNLQSFILNGGVYVGACAGAYLPLKSSLPPLHLFNFVKAKITNLAKYLPAPQKIHAKFCTEYGCSYIFHPVREEVRVRIIDGFSWKGRELIAPLYGGPSMIASDDIDVLATYAGFTAKTEFLVDQEVAQGTLLGKVAVGTKRMGEGRLYLFGPHFEHPHYPKANSIFFEAILGRAVSRKTLSHHESCESDRNLNAAKKLLRNLKSEVSNARIVALALERMPYRWLIGKKVYEPEKIRVFLEAVWSRISALEQESQVYGGEQRLTSLVEKARTVTVMLRDIQKQNASAPYETMTAEKLFVDLKILTSQFLTAHFQTARQKALGKVATMSA